MPPLMSCPVQPIPVAPPPLSEIVQVGGLPWPLVVNETLIVLKPFAVAEPAVRSGGAIVVAVAGRDGGPVPAALTARTITVTAVLSAMPVSWVLVPVTFWVAPLTVSWYPVIARPLFAPGAQDTAMVPLAFTVAAETLTGAPGTLNGTTVLDSGDGLDAVPRLLTAVTM